MKYKVTINWFGEVHELYTHSNSDNKALDNCIMQLSKIVGFNYDMVRAYVRDGKPKYTIERK